MAPRFSVISGYSTSVWFLNVSGPRESEVHQISQDHMMFPPESLTTSRASPLVSGMDATVNWMYLQSPPSTSETVEIMPEVVCQSSCAAAGWQLAFFSMKGEVIRAPR